MIFRSVTSNLVWSFHVFAKYHIHWINVFRTLYNPKHLFLLFRYLIKLVRIDRKCIKSRKKIKKYDYSNISNILYVKKNSVKYINLLSMETDSDLCKFIPLCHNACDSCMYETCWFQRFHKFPNNCFILYIMHHYLKLHIYNIFRIIYHYVKKKNTIFKYII